jgi:hypothetical protein
MRHVSQLLATVAIFHVFFIFLYSIVGFEEAFRGDSNLEYKVLQEKSMNLLQSLNLSVIDHSFETLKVEPTIVREALRSTSIPKRFPEQILGSNGIMINDCVHLVRENQTDESRDQVIQCIRSVNQLTLSRTTFSLETPKTKENFGESAKAIPFVVMAYNRAEYLRKCLNSLKQVEGINETFIIISHDGYFQPIEDVIQKELSGMQYIQIYHPYSRFWMRNLEINRSYLSQVSAKHHYWWMWNSVHKSILPRLELEAMVHLEEDHIVTRDSYMLVQYMFKFKPEGVFSFNLGKVSQIGQHAALLSRQDKVVVRKWSHLNNAGLGFDREMFLKLLQNGYQWCSFDDYNWDWSLERMAQDKVVPAALVTPEYTRVEHIGGCGLHFTSNNCEKLKNSVIQGFLIPMKQRVDPSFWKQSNVPNLPKQAQDFNTPKPHPGYQGWITGSLTEFEAVEFGFPRSSRKWNSEINRNVCLRVALEIDPL